jgi:chromosome segregation ATPase
VSLACAQRPARPPQAKPRLPSADQLFARGEYEAAKSAYEREARLGTSAEAAARARFFRALVQLAQKDAALAHEELRALERVARGSVWPRVARLLSDELARGTVLQKAMLDAGAELHLLRLRIQLLERAAEDAQQQLAERDTELQTLKEERQRVQAALRDAEERANAQAQRVRELEAALEALKNIDMQREP